MAARQRKRIRQRKSVRQRTNVRKTKSPRKKENHFVSKRPENTQRRKVISILSLILIALASSAIRRKPFRNTCGITGPWGRCS